MKQTIMLADKTGLRKKGTVRGISKYTEEDIIKANRGAVEKLRAKMLREGKISPKVIADKVREELKTQK